VIERCFGEQKDVQFSALAVALSIHSISAMELQYSREGIYVAAIDLWLDPQNSQGAAWISHAHSDHARHYSRTVIGTGISLELYRMRWPAKEEWGQELRVLEYGEEMEWRGARLRCIPAGHILGAAQLLIEYGGERLVYTGDIKKKAPLCGRETEVVECDHLIVESTFGLPVYRFLTREQAREEIAGFARECLEEGATPVFLGYPLGRGQEIVGALTGAGIRTAVHGAIAKYIPVYERAGVEFGDWEPYEARDLKGKALVVVPGMRRQLEATGVDVRVAYVSGWARVANARLRAGAEKLIAYSDHAGYDELLELVEGTKARRVDVVHGYTEVFAGILRERGIEAEAPAGARGRASEEEAE
jgi:Cft2 family RNA processing exonuclease